jgi:glutathione peroxidase
MNTIDNPSAVHTSECVSYAPEIMCICQDTPIDDVKSFYDISLKSADGEDNFLKEFEGKVTLVINVTGECGNAPQYGVIEDLYQEYKNEGFEVLAVPTNDYCGAGLTYGEHVYGCEDAKGARKFGTDKYNVTYKFSELVESNPGPGEIIPGLPGKHGVVTPHAIYKWLGFQGSKNKNTKDNGTFMAGNFEKYLVDRNGKLVAYFRNGDLLDQNQENMERGLTETGSIRASIARKKITDAIEKALVA